MEEAILENPHFKQIVRCIKKEDYYNEYMKMLMRSELIIELIQKPDFPISDKNGVEWLKQIEKQYKCKYENRGLYSIILCFYMSPSRGYLNLTIYGLEKIDSFIHNEKTLEIMAGGGIFTSLMKSKGIDVIACTDNYEDNEKPFLMDPNLNIEKIDFYDAMIKYKGSYNCVAVSWMSPRAECEKILSDEFNFEYLVYVGDPIMMCRDDEFNKIFYSWITLFDEAESSIYCNELFRKDRLIIKKRI